MSCNKHNQIVKKKKDGSQQIIIRCADPSCIHFTKEVTEEQCKDCPRYVVPVEIIPTTPSLAQRTVTYARAVAGHIAAGLPVREDDEVLRIFNTFCSKCTWYDKINQLCRGCGCAVSTSSHALTNKIKMAMQHCPKNLW